MTERQCTLAKSVEIRGKGLFLGQPVQLRCLPAEAGTGVVFVRTDLPDRPSIPLTMESVPGSQRWTAVRKGDAEVRMVEHLMATLSGLGIDNLIVEINSVEMPTGDGSAQTFVEAFLRAGMRELDAPKQRISLQRPVWIRENDVTLVALPHSGPLTITYILDYGRNFIGCQSKTVEVTHDSFVREIAPARTYVLRPEVDAFIKAGLGKGATPENTLVLEEDGRISAPMRFADECVRHKMLDLVGDLYLTGRQLSAYVIGYKSGHTANVRLAKAIVDACVAPEE